MCKTGAQCGCGGSGSAFPWLLAGAVAVVAAVAAFVLTHVLILGAALAAFAGGMGGLCVWFRRITQFRPVRREAIKHTLIPARPVTAGPKAIEGKAVAVPTGWAISQSPTATSASASSLTSPQSPPGS